MAVTTSVNDVDFTDADLAALSEKFEHQSASSIIRWAVETFETRFCLTASMNDALLIDLAVKVDRSIEVVFLDTGYHVPETLDTLERVGRHYGLNLRIMTVATQAEELWRVDPENCCSAVKVGQLDRALASKDAWMSGLRRAESPTRINSPIVARDLRGLVKVNPIATWSDLDVEGYVNDHNIIQNPLIEKGYASIGCMPCTRPVEEGEHARAGRWSGTDKMECGLHA